MYFTKDQIKKIIGDKSIKSKDDFNDLITGISKEIIETLLEGEITHHLGYEKHDHSNKKTDNSRNGYSTKEITTKSGKTEIKVPRDRKSDFEPELVKKRTKYICDLEDKIISMYANGMTTRDIQYHMKEIYGYEFSNEFVSNVTNKVLEKAKEWQSRPLKTIYTIVYLDALVLKVRKDGHVRNTAVYGIIGINIEGKKECLGLWLGDAESSKFWLGILNELKNRGVKCILIFSVDNLTGISDAIESSFPESEVQKCIVHQIRNSLKYVSWKDRKEAAKGLKNIYKVPTEKTGLEGLDDFKKKWDKKYPHISKSWERNWPELSTFFKYPEEIRRLIYTTNPIESFNSQMKKTTKNRGSFPNEDSVIKLLYLAIDKISKKWDKQIKDWGLIYSQLSIYFEDKFNKFVEN